MGYKSTLRKVLPTHFPKHLFKTRGLQKFRRDCRGCRDLRLAETRFIMNTSSTFHYISYNLSELFLLCTREQKSAIIDSNWTSSPEFQIPDGMFLGLGSFDGELFYFCAPLLAVSFHFNKLANRNSIPNFFSHFVLTI